MGNVLAIVSFVVATICIALGGFMLYRYWKFVDKATGTITIGSNGTYTYVSNGNTYIVEKNLGFLNLEENKSYTIMLNKEDKTAYVLPFDILDYRYIAWGLILIIQMLILWHRSFQWTVLLVVWTDTRIMNTFITVMDRAEETME